MKIHVLPGDALVEDFKKTNIEGEIIVCRECLVEGETRAGNLEEFWRAREKFIAAAYGEDDDQYRQTVVAEFEKLLSAPAGSEINLWFEYELFCQANMWFCLALLQNKRAKIFRVAPVVRSEKDVWKGFGDLAKEDLQKCFAERTEFSEADVQLGVNLWRAFQNKDSIELKKLGATDSECFPKLAEVCAAAIEIENRPQAALRKIAANEANFENVFAQFSAAEGVYGFGNAQVERILALSEPAA